MPAQQQTSTLHPFHSTSHRCCLRSRETCSCLVLDLCKRLGDAYRDSAKWSRDLPACSETSPSVERKGSRPCNRSPDYEYGREGVTQSRVRMPCHPQLLSQHEREVQRDSERDDRDRRFAPQTRWRTRFVRRGPWGRPASPRTSCPDMPHRVGQELWLQLWPRHPDAPSPTQPPQS